MGADLLERAPRLEVIGFPGSGFESIDTAAATRAGVAVVYAAGSQYAAVAEHAIGLMLSLAKRIGFADRQMHAERRFPPREAYSGDGWPGFPHEIDRKTVLILGFGFIGRDLARKCRAAFDMTVLAYDPYFDPMEAERQGVRLSRRRSELPELIGQADFVVLCLPLGAETRHIVGAEELRAMKPGAYLINVSRGGTVDEAALIDALRQGRIAGAGIDVFDPEPALDDHPFFSMDNTVVTPHIGGWVREALPRLVQQHRARDARRAARRAPAAPGQSGSLGCAAAPRARHGEHAMSYTMIDADTHVTEPADVWTSRVPARWKDRVPHVVERSRSRAISSG